MNMIDIGKGALSSSQIGLGCMRIAQLNKEDAKSLIQTSIEQGITLFDHADIYANGEAESRFAESIERNSSLREKIILQTKCGICPGICYDFSKKHILQSVEQSLKRLRTDYIDVLLLHRPDALMEPEEVAEAFYLLNSTGKVKCFGVSNQNPMQIALLNKYCNSKIMINQLQFSITNCGIVDQGINVNMTNQEGVMHDGSVLDYCRLHDITVQAWSPFQYGTFEGTFIENEKFPQLNAVLGILAEKYEVSKNAIAIAWILRHPGKIQTIIGSTNKRRVAEVCKATNIHLTREEWYQIYTSCNKQLP